MLVSREEGTLTSVSTNLLEALPSFHKANLGHCHVGENFPKTIDLFTSPGQVLLAAASAAQLEADYAFIRGIGNKVVQRCVSSAGLLPRVMRIDFLKGRN